ncbi:MAG: hypothetical protein QF832_05015 [SAR324 cluster bacterium]|nr:hypothetical protein [SAR324 cluster bacterium]
MIAPDRYSPMLQKKIANMKPGLRRFILIVPANWTHPAGPTSLPQAVLA